MAVGSEAAMSDVTESETEVGLQGKDLDSYVDRLQTTGLAETADLPPMSDNGDKTPGLVSNPAPAVDDLVSGSLGHSAVDNPSAQGEDWAVWL